MPLNAEADNRLAGGGDAIDHDLGPAILDTDDDHRRDIRVRPRADQGPEMQVEILAELQATIGMGNGENALDIAGNRLASRVREIIERQHQHVVAHADTAVLAPPAPEAVHGGGATTLRRNRRLEARRFNFTALDGLELVLVQGEIRNDGCAGHGLILWKLLDSTMTDEMPITSVWSSHCGCGHARQF